MACGVEPDNEVQEQTSYIVELYSAIDLWGLETTGVSDMYVMYMAYDIPNDTIFKKRVDASFETFKGKDLQFQISSSIPFNSPIITNDRSEEYFNSLFASENEWSPIYLQDIHDYHREINVFIPEEGCYEFRLKLYQTENDTTFYSPKYRLDVVKKNFEYDPDATHHYYYYGNLENKLLTD